MMISEHFSMNEVTASDWATRNNVDNSLPQELLPNVRRPV